MAAIFTNQETERTSRIVSSARKHFVQLGLEGSKISDIARDAEVAVGTVYLRFQSKEHLLAGVLKEVEAKFVAAIISPAVMKQTWPARFRHIFHAIFEVAAREPDLPQLMRLAGNARDDSWTEGAMVRDAIKQQLREGSAQGKLLLAFDIDLAASVSYGMVQGAMADIAMHGPDKIEPAVDLLAHICENWLTPDQ